MTNTILIGNKKYNFNNLNKLIDTFECNIRFNISLPFNNNGTKYDQILLNNHISISINKPLNINVERYNTIFHISKEDIESFYKNLKNYNTINSQYYQNTFEVNKFLKSINCHHNFTHLPRIGYQSIIKTIMNNITPYVIGFSIIPSITENHIFNKNLLKKKSTCHNDESEIPILLWLHNNNYLDATFCLISNHDNTSDKIILDCSIINPKLNSIIIILNCYNECYLINFDINIINNIIKNEKNILLNDNKLYFNIKNKL